MACARWKAAAKSRWSASTPGTKSVIDLEKTEMFRVWSSRIAVDGLFGRHDLIKALQGEKVEKRIDTGVVLATRKNMTNANQGNFSIPRSISYLKNDAPAANGGCAQKLRRHGRSQTFPSRLSPPKCTRSSARTVAGKSTLNEDPQRRYKPTEGRWSWTGNRRSQGPLHARRWRHRHDLSGTQPGAPSQREETILLGEEPQRFAG